MMTTLINSIPRTMALRHSLISLRNNGPKCRSNNRLNSAVSTASSPRTPSTAAGMQLQLFTTDQSNTHSSISINSTIFRRNILSARRSMVTVTQTSASQKDDTPPPSNNIDNPSSSSNDATAAPDTKGELKITSSCAARIRQLASTRPNPDKVYLRLYVDAGGCSGFQYKFLLLSEDNDDGTNTMDNPDDEEEEEDGTIDPEEDIIFVKDGMRVVIDETSLDLLRGSTIDYVQEMIRSSFAVVGNPQSESACGCGSSFAVKNFESNPALD